MDTHKHRGAGRHAGGVWNRHTAEKYRLADIFRGYRDGQQQRCQPKTAQQLLATAPKAGKRSHDADSNDKDQRRLIGQYGQWEQHKGQCQPARFSAFYKTQQPVAAPQHHGRGR